MARFKLTLEYAGTRYSGWQKQTNARTVQGELERAIADASRGRDFECQGSGRTDAGVHALMQVAHLEIAPPGSLEQFRRHINDALPPDIHVLSIVKAPHRFHARHAAVARSYLYQVARRRTAFAKPFVWWVKEPLDLAEMSAAAARFSGMHDFQSFSDDDPEEKSTKVLVDEVTVGEDGDLDPDPRGRLALSLEDGAADGRRDRRGWARRAGGRRRRSIPARARRDAGAPHRTRVGALPRARLL